MHCTFGVWLLDLMIAPAIPSVSGRAARLHASHAMLRYWGCVGGVGRVGGKQAQRCLNLLIYTMYMTTDVLGTWCLDGSQVFHLFRGTRFLG